ARSRSFPDGPTNGRPALSSASPGCSPTMSTWARLGPSPNTALVPSLYRSHPRHPCAAVRIEARVGLAGTKSAADLVGFTVLLGRVVLLPILGQAAFSLDGTTIRIDVVRGRAGGVRIVGCAIG